MNAGQASAAPDAAQGGQGARAAQDGAGVSQRRRLLLAGACAGWSGLGGGAAQAAGPSALKVAWISPQTGALAAFGVTDRFVHRALAPRLAAGLDGPHGRRSVALGLHDAASSPAQAASLAASLIADGVQMIVATATPEICNPVADVCEQAGVPCVTTIAPWQAWFHGRKGKPDAGFRWTYHFFVGIEDFADVYSGLFAKAQLGPVVGGLFGDDIDAPAFLATFPRVMAQRQLTLFDPGRIQLANPDWEGIATKLRDAQVPIVTGVLPPPLALAFFEAAGKVGYRPRMASIAKAFAFSQTVAAVNRPGLALTNEVWWSPAWPFRSALTGEKAAELASSYETQAGQPWTQTLGFSHALVDVVAEAARLAPTPDREGLRMAVSRLQVNTVAGPISFRGRSPALNVCSTPAVGGQWLREPSGRWVLQVVDNTRSPVIPVTAALKLG